MEVIVIVDAMILVLGLYLIYTTMSMNKSGKINSMMLAEEEIKKVKNITEFIKFISPVCYLFGVSTVVLGGVGIATKWIMIPYWNYIELALFLIVLMVFVRKFQKARELFVN